MKIDLSFAELHSPMFYGGVNWGLKLQSKSAKGELSLAYDRDHQELLVKYKDFPPHIIPTTNVVGMTPKPDKYDASPVAVKEQVAEAVVKPKRTAQVSGPHDHVFAGQGKGKTND